MSEGSNRPSGSEDPASLVLELMNEAFTIRELGASVIDATDIGTHAIERAVNHWKVFPLNGKLPAIPNPHPRGSRERQHCKGECGMHGHGVLDATDDISTVAHWWGDRYRGCNIGGRVPESMFVLDSDPRHGGDVTLAALEKEFGTLPETLTTVSGRGDGGCHLFYRRPPGKLSIKQIKKFGDGVDLKTSSGYVVLPPSVHPDTGKPYVALERPVATPPPWLVDLVLEKQKHEGRRPTVSRFRVPRVGPSVADDFGATHSWADILEPYGWTCLDAEPDADGARWRHPHATSFCSATIRHSCLFVYSPNTPFDVTEPSNPFGYTKFRAYAVLNFDGDLSAAAKALTQSVTR